MKPRSAYGRVAPLFRDLERGVRETEDERLAKLRYPPTGDPERWVHDGPEPSSRARNWDGRTVAEHEHVASAPGDTCTPCGFPWWPDAEAGA